MRDYVRWRLYTSLGLERIFFGVGAACLLGSLYLVANGDWVGAFTLVGFFAAALVLFLVPWFGRGLKPEPIRRSRHDR